MKAKAVDGGKKRGQGGERGKVTLHSATYRIGRKGFDAADRKKFLALLQRAIDTEGRSFEIVITGDRMSFALGPREQPRGFTAEDFASLSLALKSGEPIFSKRGGK